MIELTKLNDVKFIINCDQIEKIENRPDTTITLMNGHFYIVKESVEEVIQKVVKYKRSIHQPKGD